MIKFGYTIAYVEDVEASLAFFEAAFGLARRFVAPGGGYGELETGATALAFASRAMLRELGKTTRAPDSEAPSFEIALVADDVPAAVRRALAAGATLVQDAKEMPWGQTVAYVNDVDGFRVELCTPMG